MRAANLRSGGMSSRNIETVRKTLDLFCRNELEEAASHFAEDATLRNNVVSDVKRGRAEILEHLKRWHTMFSDASTRDEEFLEAGDTIIGLFRGEGTHTGPIGDIPATGKRYSIRYCDGKIIANEAFFDQQSMLRQLGLAT